MAFDPDAYLSSESPSGFDPDAYLAGARTRYEDPIPSLYSPTDLLAGAVRGAGSIGATILAPWDIGKDLAAGKGLSLDSNRERRQQMDEGLRMLGADPTSGSYGVGKFGAEVAGTLGAGSVLANTLSKLAPNAIRAASALETGGFGANLPWWQRIAGGAATGAAGTALINPEDAVGGAVAGGVLPYVAPPLLKAGAKAAGRVSDFVTGNLGKVRAGELMSDAAGPQQYGLRQAWENAPDNLTAAQAGAGVQNDVMPALGEIAARNDPARYRGIAEGQQAARDATMAGMARGSTAEDAALARDWFSKATAAELVPIRDSILQKMRETGKTLDEIIPLLGAKEATYVAALQNQWRMATEAAQQGVLATGERAADGQLIRNLPPGNFPRDPALVQPTGSPVGAYPIPGQPRVPPRYAPNVGPQQQFSDAASDLGTAAATARTEADALRAQISALPSSFTAAPVRDAVAARMASTVNPAEETVMSAVQKALQRAGDDPVAIAEVRKLGVNQLVGDLLATGKLSKTDAAAALTDVKKLIDRQLGPEIVDRYFKPYSKKLEYRASLELADNLRKLQKDNPAEFLKVVRGDNPDLVAKYGDWATIKEALGERRFGKAASVAAERQRDIDLAARASGATGKLADITKKDIFGFRLPWGLSREVAVANRALSAIENSLNAKTKDLISQAMVNGKSANELMSMLPAHERNAGMRWIAAGGPARYAAKAVPAAVSE